MTCEIIKDGIICFSNVKYKCPYCLKMGSDIDDKLLDRCNRNKSGITKVKCSCGKRFGFTYNIVGNAVTFKIAK